jgi:hypothetical protein
MRKQSLSSSSMLCAVFLFSLSMSSNRGIGQRRRRLRERQERVCSNPLVSLLRMLIVLFDVIESGS